VFDQAHKSFSASLDHKLLKRGTACAANSRRNIGNSMSFLKSVGQGSHESLRTPSAPLILGGTWLKHTLMLVQKVFAHVIHDTCRILSRNRIDHHLTIHKPQYNFCIGIHGTIQARPFHHVVVPHLIFLPTHVQARVSAAIVLLHDQLRLPCTGLGTPHPLINVPNLGLRGRCLPILCLSLISGGPLLLTFLVFKDSGLHLEPF
jgi:hypothetical protein